MIIIITIFLCLLILVSSFLSGSETALFSLSSFKVQEYKNSKDENERIIAALLKEPMNLLVTLMMLNVMANILVQNTVSSLFGSQESWLLTVGLPLVLVLVFGEVLPKSIAIVHNQAVSHRVASIIYKISKWLGPIRSLLTKVTFSVSRFLFFFLKKDEKVSLDELYSILKTSKREGIVHTDESDLVEGCLDLRSAMAKEIMRPRDEILFYDIDKPLTELVRLFVVEECSKLPICQKDLQDVKGVLTMEQYFFSKDQIKTKEDLLLRVKTPFFVPESTNGWSLFQTLRNKNQEMALVVDEYGSISGLITQEDLIEWVIGEIEDKRDKKTLFTQSGQNVIIASGKMEIDELEDLFDISLKRETNVVTIGGWLTEQMGDIPQAGTKYVTDDLHFYVLAAEPNRVRRVYIRRLNPQGKKK